MNKVIITLDNKGNLTFDFDGFSGSSCFEKLQELIQYLKELGVDVEVKNVQPKQDDKVQERQNHLVKEQR